MRPEDIAVIMYWSALIATFIALAIATISVLAQKPKKEQYQTITVEKCYTCGYSEERPYREGDYVGKETKKCPKCGGQMYVDSIYEIRVPSSSNLRLQIQRKK